MKLLILIAFTVIQRPDFIKEHQWKNRVLLVFSNPENENAKMQVSELMNQREELLERDLLLYQIDENNIIELLTQNEIDYSPTLVCEYYKVAPRECSIILIGKDGGIKLSKNRYVEPLEIFNLIDSMPMRQSEMRRKKN
jgi:hypothetical protein